MFYNIAFLMSVLVSLKVFCNVSSYLGHNDINKLQCTMVLIWLKLAYLQKYLRMFKSKKNCFQALS